MSNRSRRPYLIRAIYQWTLDNDLTPYLLVAADQPNVSVPAAYVKDQRIALDISPTAVRELNLDADPLFFSARFGVSAFDLVIPSGAVLAIYARENGEGLIFGEPETSTEPPENPEPEPAKPAGRPKLRIVK